MSKSSTLTTNKKLSCGRSTVQHFMSWMIAGIQVINLLMVKLYVAWLKTWKISIVQNWDEVFKGKYPYLWR